MTDVDVVVTTGNQTIGGIKTFTAQPVLPQAPVLSTVKASTSGTSVDFTGIPSWVKRITMLLSAVSTSGSSLPLVRLGSGSFQATGYAGSGSTVANAATLAAVAATGAQIGNTQGAITSMTGSIRIENLTGNIWVITGVVGRSDTGANDLVGSWVTLSGTLDRVQLTTTNGTDTFDQGLVNILYE